MKPIIILALRAAVPLGRWRKRRDLARQRRDAPLG
jgi:uncharacterized protein YeaC (DUF1315 family)